MLRFKMGRSARARSMADAGVDVDSGFAPSGFSSGRRARDDRQGLLREDEPEGALPLPRPEWREQPFDASSRPWS